MVHLKMLINVRRSRLVRVHMFAGTGEIATALVATAARASGAGAPVLAAAAYTQAALGAMHALTSFGQMRALFGVQALMVRCCGRLPGSALGTTCCLHRSALAP